MWYIKLNNGLKKTDNLVIDGNTGEVEDVSIKCNKLNTGKRTLNDFINRWKITC